jgi:hypothetical protein
VGVDDQLFKEDGTLITRIDNLLLKIAALICAPFLGEDDETYDGPKATFLRVGGLLFIPGLIMLQGPLVLSGLIGIIFLVGCFLTARDVKCNSRGSTIDRSEKFGYLMVDLILVSSIGAFTASAQPGPAIMFVGLTIFVLTMLYVVRLGSPPPKKQKATAPKAILHH